MKQQPCQIGIFGFQIELIIGSPVFKQGKPGGTNGHMNGPIEELIFSLHSRVERIFIDQALRDFTNVS